MNEQRSEDRGATPDNRSLEELLEQLSPLHNPPISLLAMREAARVIRELKAQDEVHWKTRRTLLRDIESLRSGGCEYSDSGQHECKHCDQEWGEASRV